MANRDRFTGAQGHGEITGSGWVILRWPNEIEYKIFADRGILKQDGLTLGLCDQICAQCLVYPDAEKFKAGFKGECLLLEKE